MKGTSWLQICVFLHFCAIHNWNLLPNMTDTSIGLNFPISNRSVHNLYSIRDSCHLVKQLRHGSTSAVGRQADLCLRCLHLVYCSTNGMIDSLIIREISIYLYELIYIIPVITVLVGILSLFLYVSSSVGSRKHADGPEQCFYIFICFNVRWFHYVCPIYASWCMSGQMRLWLCCTAVQCLLCSHRRRSAYFCVPREQILEFYCLIAAYAIKCTVDMVLDTGNAAIRTQRVSLHQCIELVLANTMASFNYLICLIVTATRGMLYIIDQLKGWIGCSSEICNFGLSCLCVIAPVYHIGIMQKVPWLGILSRITTGLLECIYLMKQFRPRLCLLDLQADLGHCRFHGDHADLLLYISCMLQRILIVVVETHTPLKIATCFIFLFLAGCSSNVITHLIDAGFCNYDCLYSLACRRPCLSLPNHLLFKEVRRLGSWSRHLVLSMDPCILYPFVCTIHPLKELLLLRNRQKSFRVTPWLTTVMPLVKRNQFNNTTRVKRNFASCNCQVGCADGCDIYILKLICYLAKQLRLGLGHVILQAKPSPSCLQVSFSYSISEVHIHPRSVC